MNYDRIYSEFIADRLTKQPVKPDYFEKHHILPRALGGGNEKSNIIRLTPEDHYFAHCCLAKIYGGRMWYAIKAMSDGWVKAKDTKYLKNRAMAGVSRKRFANENRKRMAEVIACGEFVYGFKVGEDNVLHNSFEYEWVNLDSGVKRKATIYGMWKEFGGSRAHWTSVQSGARKSHVGWAVSVASVRIRGLKGKRLSFVNRDGRTFTGTQSEFCKFAHIGIASASRVSRHGDVTTCGWRLQGTPDRSHLSVKKTGSPARLNSGASHKFEKNGIVFCGKVSDLALHFGSTKQQVHSGLSQIKAGRINGYKGWSYKGIEAKSR